MTLDALIMLAGALVGIWPFLGFPPSWDTVILFVLGAFIFALGIVVRRRDMGSKRSEGHVPVAREPFASQVVDDGEAA